MTTLSAEAGVQAALEFIEALYGRAESLVGQLVLWTADDKRSQWFPTSNLQQFAEAAASAAASTDTYFGVALQDQSAARIEKATGDNTTPDLVDVAYLRGSKRTTTAIPALWIEVDWLHPVHGATRLPPSCDDALQLVNEFELQPSVTIDSGHGLHAWWLFREPWVFDDAQERDRAQELVEDFQATMRVKAANHGWTVDVTADLARLLRLPGTWNRKEKTALPVRRCLFEPLRRYSPDDFERYLVGAPRNGNISMDGPMPDPVLPNDLSDDQIIACVLSNHGAKGKLLWRGEWAKVQRAGGPAYKSQNEADSALLYILRFYTGGDAEKIDRIFRTSGLMREKWDEQRGKETYGAFSLRKALHGDFAVYASPLLKSTGNGTVNHADTPTAQGPDEARSQWIQANARLLPDMTHDGLLALVAGNSPPRLFQRAKELVRVVEAAAVDAAEKRPVIQPLTESGLRGELARAAAWIMVRKTNVPCSPPIEVVRDIQSLPVWPVGIPPLTGIIEAPALRPDGSIISESGYDLTTGLFHQPSSALHMPPVPEHPTASDIAIALSAIDDVLGEFPFDSAASQANAIAFLLTPIVRPALGSSTVPLAILDAPQQGTGKGLIANIVSIIATGREAAAAAAPSDEAEWSKSITTWVRSGRPFVLIDNVDVVDWRGNPMPLRSAALSALLTASTYNGRILGATSEVELPTRATWALTGNNVQVSGDLIRRCYRIRLDAKQAQPWLRTGFTHETILEYAKEQRGALLHALLTLARAYFDRGRPKPSTTALGSYETWCRTVGGILEVAGITGFLSTQQALYAASDGETPEWEGFLTCWQSVYGDTWITAADLDSAIQDMNRPLRDALPLQLSDQLKETSFKKLLGQALKKKLDVRHGSAGLHLESRDNSHTKVKEWRVTTGTP